MLQRQTIIFIIIITLTIFASNELSANRLLDSLHNLELDAKIPLSTSVERIDLLNSYKLLGIHNRKPHYLKLTDKYYEALALSQKIGDKNREGESLVNILYLFFRRGMALRAVQQDTESYYMNYSKKIVKQIDNEHIKAKLYAAIGRIHWAYLDYENAIKYLLDALKYSKDTDDYQLKLGINGKLSDLYRRLELYDKSLTFAKRAYEIYKKHNDLNEGIRWIVNVYASMKKYKEELKFRLIQLEKCKNNNDMPEHSKSRNMASVTIRIADCYYNLENYNKALEYVEKYFKLLKKLNNTRDVGNDLNIASKIYVKLGRYEEAIECQRKAIDINTKYAKDNMSMSTYYNRIGWCFFKNNQYDSALAYYQKGITHAKRHNIPYNTRDIYNNMYLLYYKLGNLNKALQYYIKYVDLRDSLHKEVDIGKIGKWQTKFDIKTKELKNKELKAKNIELELKHRNNTIMFIVGLLILVIILAILLYLRQKQKKALHILEIENLRINKRKNEAELASLRARLQALELQMSPHFIFNSINSIQYLIVNNKDADAVSYLAHFAKLMRGVMENSVCDTITLSEEIKFLMIYLDLERLRFNNKFDYFINIDNKIDQNDVSIPPMLLQPFVENSIKHGLKHLESNGKLIINIERQNGTLLIEIEDNGIGRELSLKAQGNYHKENATDITKKRIDIMNSIWGQPINLEIIDEYDEMDKPSGTKVKLYITLRDSQTV